VDAGGDTVPMGLPARHGNEILPGLWVSAMPQSDWDLEAFGVRLVVTLSDHLPPQAARRYEWGTRGEAAGDGSIVFLHWPIEDGDLPDTTSCDLVVDTVCRFLVRGRPVLVHCNEGRNRSGLVVALAVRQLTGCSGSGAIDAVRSRRSGMLSNRAFVAALEGLPALELLPAQPSVADVTQ